jgi:membrane protein DedA with SNARE-associated domain
MQELAGTILNWMMHLDIHLAQLAATHGAWVYLILFAVIFIETGCVVMPFLPGDSLLFIAGALAAKGPFDPWLLLAPLIAAAIAGDSLNFAFGTLVRRRAIDTRRIPFLKTKHLQRTHAFFERHGGKTVVLARFVPVLRTAAPFVAALGAMPARVFLAYNVAGGTLWVASLLLAGHLFGAIPWVSNNLTAVVLGIVLLSLTPALAAWFRTRPWTKGGSADWRYWLAGATAVLLLCRLALMALAPLADTTEARYGELARQTLVNGYWLMPHMDAQTPFFAKPPLSTWASAASMGVFGINEFAARLPALLASAVTLWITAAFSSLYGVRQRWLVAPVLAASPLFFISAGAVMTDAIQMTVVWAAHYCAWRAMQVDERAQGLRWRLGFWALVGVGALSKGLATWLLIALPLVAYALLQRRLVAMLRRVFDAAGVALACAIFLPWYIAAERSYPGFLNYFIIGEHFSRFLVPGWVGDRYGTAHRQPLGAIWLFWAGAVLPWLHVFVRRFAAMLRRPTGPKPAAGWPPQAPLASFLWCATLAPLVFFTFSRNIIWTYALTAVPPFAVLVVHWLENGAPATRRRAAYGLAAYGVVAVLLAPFILHQVNANSERALVRAFERQAPAGAQLSYMAHPTFSSAFYARESLKLGVPGADTGRAFVVVDNQELRRQPIPAGRVVFSGARRSLVEVN